MDSAGVVANDDEGMTTECPTAKVLRFEALDVYEILIDERATDDWIP
jgi:hypothetical protein